MSPTREPGRGLTLQVTPLCQRQRSQEKERREGRETSLQRPVAPCAGVGVLAILCIEVVARGFLTTQGADCIGSKPGPVTGRAQAQEPQGK